MKHNNNSSIKDKNLSQKKIYTNVYCNISFHGSKNYIPIPIIKESK